MVFRVLMTTAPRVKYDLTLDYRYCDFGEVIDFLRRLPNVSISVFDGGVINHSVREYIEKFLSDYDLVIFYAETADARMTKELAETCKKLSPSTKITVYGDATLYIPQYFTRHPFDAVHISGDQDIVLADYIRFLQKSAVTLHGLSILNESGWQKTQPGKLLSSEEWGFPAIDVLPLEEYRTFKGNALLEGSVYIAKGCRYACPYCVLPRREGLIDRRRPISLLLKYLESSKNVFSAYQLHAGTFTEDRDWVIQFCKELHNANIDIKWKCTTRVDRLDEELISIMASVGCQSINVGVESLTLESSSAYNKAHLSALENLASWLSNYDVKSTAFIMVGMPNHNEHDVVFSIETLEAMGYIVRPTGYTPFQKLSDLPVEKLDEINLEKWDRKSLWNPDSGIGYREFQKFLLLSYGIR